MYEINKQIAKPTFNNIQNSSPILEGLSIPGIKVEYPQQALSARIPIVKKVNKYRIVSV